ncbi:hypothetical protein TraAM80_03370 [Trypanosoma rangeli]|uniref:Uncharacterized protein n=1 Tax=Trypanosoma rangeli TaxID=5698 RepID=A0A3R7MSR9_TRYRA|nr:uncharacterized protein TraAM80_03370 [Trypanosoma rangeli]RNF07514.1 hypothetical protein TraAM80_03370 [Trypanosoma rangeli]|eukprot:RNF07514.1 hypothetical protein TraAM80_03370 [Trypanosoma rangeli]
MPPKVVMATEVDPMLQGTYLQDDADDFVSTSEALDRFEARLARGEGRGPVHSERPSRKHLPQAYGAAPVPHLRKSHAVRQQSPTQQQLCQQSRNGRKSADGLCRANEGLTDDVQERLEDIEAVRQLGNDIVGDED